MLASLNAEAKGVPEVAQESGLCDNKCETGAGLASSLIFSSIFTFDVQVQMIGFVVPIHY